MPLPYLTARREYSGGAVKQVTTSDLTSTGTVVNLDSATNWSTGAGGAGGFYVLIAEGTAAEEKALVASRTGLQLTFSQRGADGSTAYAHPAGATIRPWYAATDADEANAHTSSANAVHGVAGNVLGDVDAQDVFNKTLDGTNALIDYTLSPHDHSNAANGGAPLHGALVTFTYASGWADNGVGSAAGGFRVDAMGYVKVQGLVKATTASGVVQLAQGLPTPLDGASHYFPVYDTTNGTWGQVQLVPGTPGHLDFNTSVTTGHSYTLENIGYQS